MNEQKVFLDYIQNNRKQRFASNSQQNQYKNSNNLIENSNKNEISIKLQFIHKSLDFDAMVRTVMFRERNWHYFENTLFLETVIKRRINRFLGKIDWIIRKKRFYLFVMIGIDGSFIRQDRQYCYWPSAQSWPDFSTAIFLVVLPLWEP